MPTPSASPQPWHCGSGRGLRLDDGRHLPSIAVQMKLGEIILDRQRSKDLHEGLRHVGCAGTLSLAQERHKRPFLSPDRAIPNTNQCHAFTLIVGSVPVCRQK
jgi:hypothetical protein